MKRPNRWAPASLFVASLVIIATVLSPPSLLPAAQAGRAGAEPSAHASGGLTGTVTWNGVDVGQASTPSGALQVDYNSHVDVRYFWNATHAGATYTISTVRLQMFYFGFALANRDVPPLDQKSADMGWDAAGSLKWLLEGTYLLTASLIAPNGTTMWSESFYMHLSAPYSLLAALPLLLVLLLVYELYAVIRSGAPPTSKPKQPSPPPASKTAGGSTGKGDSGSGAQSTNGGSP